MRQSVKKYNRIVLKIGSSLLCPDWENLNLGLFQDIAEQIAALVQGGKQLVVVSSGAIALGMHELGLKDRPGQLYNLSASAAIGQNALMNTYSKFLGAKVRTAQVLLTWDDFADRKRYLSAKQTIEALLKYRSVPIVNENDTVSTDEIKFGDNDRLSALVAKLISADILIILSDIDGLLDKNKNVIPVVQDISPQIKSLACPTNKKVCVGGMVTKIEAAKIAVDSGIPCVIANGRKKDIILSVLKEPRTSGTLFVPKKGLKAREHWIAFGTKPKGNIIVDDGAKQALLNKKSLLSVGITGCFGDFETGDIVSLKDKSDDEFARGKISLGNKELDKVKGKRYHKEIIHRDNIVIL
ncbi:MAG: glutamate 5-kinase [Omnitrophica WOR_2 bacterium RBG_13_44_8b]|nr:MAG: glutamate 5-kinase [Omnitrophica WOR_2 bacterium RBG_13_44_8b]